MHTRVRAHTHSTVWDHTDVYLHVHAITHAQSLSLSLSLTHTHTHTHIHTEHRHAEEHNMNLYSPHMLLSLKQSHTDKRRLFKRYRMNVWYFIMENRLFVFKNLSVFEHALHDNNVDSIVYVAARAHSFWSDLDDVLKEIERTKNTAQTLTYPLNNGRWSKKDLKLSSVRLRRWSRGSRRKAFWGPSTPSAVVKRSGRTRASSLSKAFERGGWEEDDEEDMNVGR